MMPLFLLPGALPHPHAIGSDAIVICFAAALSLNLLVSGPLTSWRLGCRHRGEWETFTAFLLVTLAVSASPTHLASIGSGLPSGKQLRRLDLEENDRRKESSENTPREGTQK